MRGRFPASGLRRSSRDRLWRFSATSDAAQRDKRVYARLRRAMALREAVRCRAGAVQSAVFLAIPVLRSSAPQELRAASRPGNETLVIAGLDPAIHLLRKTLVKSDG